MMPHPSNIFYLSIIATGFLARTPTKNNNLLCTAQLLPDDPENVDYYCGWDWEEASANCEFHCPSGLDGDCPPLLNGRKRRCIAATGCFVRFKKVYWTGVISLSFDREEHLANNAVVDTMTPAEDTVDEPTAVGLMTEEEVEAFESSFQNYLFEALNEQLQISGVSVQEQEYDRPCVAAANRGDDPTSTSLDLTVGIVGEYIPIGDKFFTDEQFGEKILAFVNADSESFVDAIQNNSPSFFDAMTGISAIDEESVVEPPSSMPSAPPTRGFDQIFDIRIDPQPTGSYGIVFDVKTVRCDEQTAIQKTCGTILLTGMSFVTLHEGKLEYMIYSKLGPYERFIGNDKVWDLVASGQAMGRGAKQYTPVLENDTVVDFDSDTTLNYVGFKPLHIPGDRGQRSFYITLTKRFTTDDGGPIPILFRWDRLLFVVLFLSQMSLSTCPTIVAVQLPNR